MATFNHDITIVDEADALANAIVSDLPPQKPETIPELARINELALKAKTHALSDEEIAEQDSLRKIYLQRFRGNVQSLMASVTVQDEAGNDGNLRNSREIHRLRRIHPGRTAVPRHVRERAHPSHGSRRSCVQRSFRKREPRAR